MLMATTRALQPCQEEGSAYLHASGWGASQDELGNNWTALHDRTF